MNPLAVFELKHLVEHHSLFELDWPEIADNCFGIYPAGNLVRLTTGEIAVVLKTHAADPYRPRVRVLRDASGMETTRVHEINLWDEGEGPRTAIQAPLDPAEYGIDPLTIGRAVEILCAEHGVDHVALNFGCPVPKVTRKGGGAAVPEADLPRFPRGPRWDRDPQFDTRVNALKAVRDAAAQTTGKIRPSATSPSRWPKIRFWTWTVVSSMRWICDSAQVSRIQVLARGTGQAAISLSSGSPTRR